MQAFDLYFDHGDWLLPYTDGDDGSARHRVARPDRHVNGWDGSEGPAIAADRWPLDTRTGRRLQHALALRLPPDYQRRGPGRPGIAFFFGEDVDGEQPMGVVASTDPHAVRFTDGLGTEFALLWLTDAELDIGAHDGDESAIWLFPREDPNAGIAPVEYPGNDLYEDPTDPEHADEGALKPWAEELIARSHLGGTAFPEQGMPELSPYYLEIDELGGLNFGTGSARIDLELGTMDWAC